MASQCASSSPRNGGAPAKNFSVKVSKPKKGRFRGTPLALLAQKCDDSKESRMARGILENMHHVANEDLHRSHVLSRASTDPVEDRLLQLFPCLTRDLVSTIIRFGKIEMTMLSPNSGVASQDVTNEYDDTPVDDDFYPYSVPEPYQEPESPELPEPEPYGSVRDAEEFDDDW